MILKMFSIYDTKTGMFHTPFFAPHTGIAIRMMSDLGQDLSTVIGRHPHDFTLYELGGFDDATAVYTPIAPNNLGPIASFLPTKQSNLFNLQEITSHKAENGDAR